LHIRTTDPITGNAVTDLEHSPYIVSGDLTTWFETGAGKAGLLGIEIEHPGEDFEHRLDNPSDMGPGNVHTK